MRRRITDNLIAWKDNASDEPVILTGAHGVGKTYIAIEFAKNNFEQHLYVNLETDGKLRRFIREAAADAADDSSLCELLCSYFEIPQEYSHNLIYIIDGIDFCAEARTMLEECRGFRIIAIAVHEAVLGSELVSRCKILRVYPLTFDEFLIAQGREWYRDIITAHFEKMKRVPEIVHNELMDYFETYLNVGGMPQAINEYNQFESDEAIASCQQTIYNNLIRSIELFYDDYDTLRQCQIFSVIEKQLAKANKKFQFSQIRRGGSQQLYGNAISALESDGSIIITQRALEEEERASIRVYPLDVGLLSYRMRRLDDFELDEQKQRSLLEEMFVIQELTASGRCPSYWESDARAKLDVIANIDGAFIPCDLRSNISKHSKSLNIYCQQNNPEFIYRLWEKNFELSDNKKCVPLYAAFCI